MVEKKIVTVIKLPHGYFPGEIKESEVFPPVPASMMKASTVVKVIKTPHGYYHGEVKDAEVLPSIASSSVAFNTLIQKGGLPIKNATKTGYQIAEVGDGINLSYPESDTRRGRVQKKMSATIQTGDQMGVLEPNERIRRLTPKECWRLMGFTDNDFAKAKKVNSDTQLYKQAGNSIVVQVLEAIFKEML